MVAKTRVAPSEVTQMEANRLVNSLRIHATSETFIVRPLGVQCRGSQSRLTSGHASMPRYTGETKTSEL